jgi:hypothetical protein
VTTPGSSESPYPSSAAQLTTPASVPNSPYETPSSEEPTTTLTSTLQITSTIVISSEVSSSSPESITLTSLTPVPYPTGQGNTTQPSVVPASEPTMPSPYTVPSSPSYTIPSGPGGSPTNGSGNGNYSSPTPVSPATYNGSAFVLGSSSKLVAVLCGMGVVIAYAL